MIKNIIFDLSEVLIPGMIGVENKLSHYLKVTPDAICKAMGSYPYFSVNNHLDKLFTDEISLTNYLFKIRSDLNLDSSYDHVITEFILKCFNDPYPYSIQLISELKDHFNLILYSDHCKDWIEYIISRHPFLANFNKHIYSYEVGRTKKDIKSFEILIDLEKINPTESLFVDDNAMNVINAKSTGFKTILFKGEQSIKEIKTYFRKT